MSKRAFLKNISLILALIVVVYFVSHYAGLAKNKVFDMLHIPGSSVQGASTQRAQEISSKLQSDLHTQLQMIMGQLLNLTVSDAVSGLSRFQKIPQDIKAVQEFATDQTDKFLNK